MLAAAGHVVTGTTRSLEKARFIRAAGAVPEVLDALDANQVRAAVKRARPEVIVHQLTAIPAKFDLRRFDEEFAMTNRLRTEATDHLLAAAREVGCRRIIAQSYAGWNYARTGGWIKTEEDPLVSLPEPAFRNSLQAILHLESAVTKEPGIEGFVLRYGGFYGPGTSLSYGGSTLQEVQNRSVPVIGKGTGYWSFIHIDDAAGATLAALQASEPGIYNIVDDEPAPVSQWLPYLAEVIGAKPPMHVPAWLGRIVGGAHLVAMMTEVRGASNQKAKRLLDWKLKWPSWREGFRSGLRDGLADLRIAS
jgi:nucleoside-diphosphate-sugar epimerase